MRAGPMRHLVTFQRQSSVQAASGAPQVQWNTLFEDYVWIEPWIGSARSGRETFDQNQLLALDYTRIHCRYNSNTAQVTPKDRVLYSAASGAARVFDIQAINNKDERNVELEMIAKERQGASNQ